MSRSQYQVARWTEFSHSRLVDFHKLIEGYMDDGWVLQGGVSVFPEILHMGNETTVVYHYCQAMTQAMGTEGEPTKSFVGRVAPDSDSV